MPECGGRERVCVCVWWWWYTGCLVELSTTGVCFLMSRDQPERLRSCDREPCPWPSQNLRVPPSCDVHATPAVLPLCRQPVESRTRTCKRKENFREYTPKTHVQQDIAQRHHHHHHRQQRDKENERSRMSVTCLDISSGERTLAMHELGCRRRNEGTGRVEEKPQGRVIREVKKKPCTQHTSLAYTYTYIHTLSTHTKISTHRHVSTHILTHTRR
jgi:hypothetical protein